MHLFVAATKEEINPLLENFHDPLILSPGHYQGVLRGKVSEILITGIGATAMAFHLARTLSQKSYHQVISMGIAGSFSENQVMGEVVQVTCDCFADLGIDDNGIFRNVYETGLDDGNKFPFCSGLLYNPSPLPYPYRTVTGITVQTASGSKKRITDLSKNYHPEIETMENAAFFYACKLLKVPFASFRAISNKVEPRNKKKWNIPLAILEVNKAVIKMITE